VFLTTTIRSLARALRRRRRIAVALLGATAVLGVTAASASAYTLNPLTPDAGWSANACCNGGPPGWYQDGFGIIHLEGALTQPTPGGPQLITTLPPPARPNRNVFVTVHTLAGTYANLVVEPNGAVIVISPNPKFFTQDLGFVSLEGITYQPGNRLPTTPINLNGGNWSQSAGHSTVIPQWYKDGSGTVHLEGAARQTVFGANSNFLGQLPHAAAPLHEVTTLVHANSGTWAQLFILPDGRMFTNSINGGFPSDLSFLSLEGVSYNASPFINDLSSNLNVANWAPASAFGFAGPGWFEDGAGIVHLQGEVSQISSRGPTAGLILALPRVIAPNRAIFTIVITADGAYADVAILPTGQVVIAFPDRLPATNDLAYLSLDSITYQTADTPGPHGLTLTRSGEVIAVLHKPRDLRLTVFELGHKAHLVGTVALGSAPVGRSRFAWNLRVAGHRLPAGTYTAELTAAGSTTGGPGVVFKVTRDGRVRVASSTCAAAAALGGRC
jgi:hypothetical protein